MNQQDKLRDTLRGYYDTQETSFSDGEWERASAYVDAAKAKKRRRRAAIVIMAVVSGLFIVFYTFREAAGNERLVSDKATRPVPVAQSAAVLPVLEPPASRPARAARAYQRPAKAVAPAAALQENTLEHSDPAPDRPVKVMAAPAIEPEEKQIPQRVPEAGSTFPAAEPALPVSAVFTPADAPVVSETARQAETAPPLAETIPVLPAAAPLATVAEAPALTAAKETGATDSAALTLPALTIAPATNTPAPVAGSTATVLAVKDTLQGPLPLAGEGIYYEAGAAWMYGWKGASQRDARGFSPVAGIGYMNRLSRRSAFSFGLQYLQVRNLSNSSKTSRVSSYRYGEQSQVTVIAPSAVHYLVAPLRFHYHIDRRNSFGAGINLAYLLNVDAAVTTYDEKPGASENYETVKLSGYTEGFLWYDSQLAFSYRRMIAGSLGVQAEVFVGLTDVKQDKFFGFKGKERNSGAKLSLVYYVLRKNSR